MNKPALIGLVALVMYFMHRRALASNEVTDAATVDYNGYIPQFAIDGPFDVFPDITEQAELNMTNSPIVPGTLTRGERNNNPGNLRKSASKWQGMAADQSKDPAFVVFESPEYGIRAMGVLLRNYAKQGYNTVRKVISKYAPSTENNTSAYMQNVAARIGATLDQSLNLDDDNTLHALVSAIILQENGRNIYADNGILDAGINMVA